MSKDFSSVLASTQNFLANHGIPRKNHNIVELSLDSKKLSQQYDASVESAAQLFFAQRGQDLTQHIHSVLTTQQTYIPVQQNAVIDFDIDYYTESQRNLLISNIAKTSTSYQEALTTDIFSRSLADDWNAAKYDIVNNMDFSISLPSLTADLSSNIPLLSALSAPIPPFTTLTPLLSRYLDVTYDLSASLSTATRQHSLHAIRSTILDVPLQLVEISKELEQLEISLPGSTLSSSSSSSSPSSPDNIDTQPNQSTNNILTQHEQTTDIWLLFANIAHVIKAVVGIDNTTSIQPSPLSSSSSTLSQKYMYKNWFLPTETRHGILGSILYLQQIFNDHMISTIQSDTDLSLEYSKAIHTIEDDTIIAYEQIASYTQSRVFRTRFMRYNQATSTNDVSLLGYNSNANISNDIGTYGNNTTFNEYSQHPNIVFSPQNVWSYVYCALRSEDYTTAIAILSTAQEQSQQAGPNNDLGVDALMEALGIYDDSLLADPLTPVLLDQELVLRLYNEMIAYDSLVSHPHSMATQTSFPLTNPFRRLIYSLIGQIPLSSHEIKTILLPYVLTSIEDYLWYSLRMIHSASHPEWSLPHQVLPYTQQQQSQQRSSSSSSTLSNDPQDIFSLSALQQSILVGTKQGSTGSTPSHTHGPFFSAYLLLLSQQYDRAIIELYRVSPTIGYYVATMSSLLGFIRCTTQDAEVITPVMISAQQLDVQFNGPSLYHHHQSGSGGSGASSMTRYAINLTKLNTIFTTALSQCDHKYSIATNYLTRFIPVYSNIPLYISYIHVVDGLFIQRDGISSSSSSHNTTNTPSSSSQPLYSLEYSATTPHSSPSVPNNNSVYASTFAQNNTILSTSILTGGIPSSSSQQTSLSSPASQLSTTILLNKTSQNGLDTTQNSTTSHIQSVYSLELGLDLPFLVALILNNRNNLTSLIGVTSSPLSFDLVSPGLLQLLYPPEACRLLYLYTLNTLLTSSSSSSTTTTASSPLSSSLLPSSVNTTTATAFSHGNPNTSMINTPFDTTIAANTLTNRTYGSSDTLGLDTTMTSSSTAHSPISSISSMTVALKPFASCLTLDSIHITLTLLSQSGQIYLMGALLLLSMSYTLLHRTHQPRIILLHQDYIREYISIYGHMDDYDIAMLPYSHGGSNTTTTATNANTTLNDHNITSTRSPLSSYTTTNGIQRLSDTTYSASAPHLLSGSSSNKPLRTISHSINPALDSILSSQPSPATSSSTSSSAIKYICKCHQTLLDYSIIVLLSLKCDKYCPMLGMGSSQTSLSQTAPGIHDTKATSSSSSSNVSTDHLFRMFKNDITPELFSSLDQLGLYPTASISSHEVQQRLVSLPAPVQVLYPHIILSIMKIISLYILINKQGGAYNSQTSDIIHQYRNKAQGIASFVTNNQDGMMLPSSSHLNSSLFNTTNTTINNNNKYNNNDNTTFNDAMMMGHNTTTTIPSSSSTNKNDIIHTIMKYAYDM